MKLHDFYYDLPPELIAQTPLQKRDASRMLHLDKKTGEIEHRHFYDLIDCLRPEDALVWFTMIHGAFEKYGIGRAAWSYRQMDFGLSDARMDGVREELVKVL